MIQLTKKTMDGPQHKKVVEAMARAAWWQSGEPEPWHELPADVRNEWISYQEAALLELKKRVPEIRRILNL